LIISVLVMCPPYLASCLFRGVQQPCCQAHVPALGLAKLPGWGPRERPGAVHPELPAFKHQQIRR